MSNETKRDVFNDLLEELADANIELDGEGIGFELTNEDKQVYLKDYDNALPDNLPVIPKAIGEYITSCKARMMDLHDSMFNWLRSEEEDEFMACYPEIFALAWVRGAWCVEETGEIVKLGAEK